METSSAQEILAGSPLSSVTGETGEIVGSVAGSITRLTVRSLAELSTAHKPDTFSVRAEPIILAVLVDDTPGSSS